MILYFQLVQLKHSLNIHLNHKKKIFISQKFFFVVQTTSTSTVLSFRFKKDDKLCGHVLILWRMQHWSLSVNELMKYWMEAIRNQSGEKVSFGKVREYKKEKKLLCEQHRKRGIKDKVCSTLGKRKNLLMRFTKSIRLKCEFFDP